jgi:hypothetical protein
MQEQRGDVGSTFKALQQLKLKLCTWKNKEGAKTDKHNLKAERHMFLQHIIKTEKPHVCAGSQNSYIGHMTRTVNT